MRGIIIETDGKKAILLKDNGTFSKIPDNGYTVGEQITLSSSPYKQLLYAACLVLTMISFFAGYDLYYTPASFVYMDINPSIRLDINCFDIVIDVVPLNEDATVLVNEYKFKSNYMERCINDIVTSCKEEKYLNENNNDIKINIATSSTKLENKINNVSEKLKENNYVVDVEKIDEETNTKAIIQKMSPICLESSDCYTTIYGSHTSYNSHKSKDDFQKESKDSISKTSNYLTRENHTKNSNAMNSSSANTVYVSTEPTVGEKRSLNSNVAANNIITESVKGEPDTNITESKNLGEYKFEPILEENPLFEENTQTERKNRHHSVENETVQSSTVTSQAKTHEVIPSGKEEDFRTVVTPNRENVKENANSTNQCEHSYPVGEKPQDRESKDRINESKISNSTTPTPETPSNDIKSGETQQKTEAESHKVPNQNSKLDLQSNSHQVGSSADTSVKTGSHDQNEPQSGGQPLSADSSHESNKFNSHTKGVQQSPDTRVSSPNDNAHNEKKATNE